MSAEILASVRSVSVCVAVALLVLVQKSKAYNILLYRIYDLGYGFQVSKLKRPVKRCD